MEVHAGHRERLRQRFLEHGPDSMEEHVLLELLLCYACPRIDVNPLAHTLLRQFGSLSQVLDAPIDDLKKVKGIGDNAAILLKLVPQLGRRYAISRGSTDEVLNTTAKAGKYLIPFFETERDEVVYLLCLDAKCKVLACRQLFRGSVNSTVVNIRTAVETALRYKATSVIVAHNHTSGFALPSEDDKYTTLRLRDALQAVDITLVDHIIVAEQDFVSMADSGYFQRH